MDKFLLRAQMGAVLPEGVVLHASSVVGKSGDGGLVFLAPSGGGKSTIMINLSTYSYGAIADDSVVIATGTDGVIRCLPCGSMKQNTGTYNIGAAPLKGFFFVEKGGDPLCMEVSGKYAFYRAMRSLSIMAYGHITPSQQKQARIYLAKILNLFPVRILRYNGRKSTTQLLCNLLDE